MWRVLGLARRGAEANGPRTERRGEAPAIGRCVVSAPEFQGEPMTHCFSCGSRLYSMGAHPGCYCANEKCHAVNYIQTFPVRSLDAEPTETVTEEET